MTLRPRDVRRLRRLFRSSRPGYRTIAEERVRAGLESLCLPTILDEMTPEQRDHFAATWGSLEHCKSYVLAPLGRA